MRICGTSWMNSDAHYTYQFTAFRFIEIDFVTLITAIANEILLNHQINSIKDTAATPHAENAMILNMREEV